MAKQYNDDCRQHRVATQNAPSNLKRGSPSHTTIGCITDLIELSILVVNSTLPDTRIKYSIRPVQILNLKDIAKRMVTSFTEKYPIGHKDMRHY